MFDKEQILKNRLRMKICEKSSGKHFHTQLNVLQKVKGKTSSLVFFQPQSSIWSDHHQSTYWWLLFHNFLPSVILPVYLVIALQSRSIGGKPATGSCGDTSSSPV